MNNFTYSIPTKIHFGKGQIAHLSELRESGERFCLSMEAAALKKQESMIPR